MSIQLAKDFDTWKQIWDEDEGPHQWIDLNADGAVDSHELFSPDADPAGIKGAVDANIRRVGGEAVRGALSEDEYDQRYGMTKGEAASASITDMFSPDADDNPFMKAAKYTGEMALGAPMRTGTMIGDALNPFAGDEGRYKESRDWEWGDEGLDALFTGMVANPLRFGKFLEAVKPVTKAGGGTGILPNIASKIKTKWSGKPATPGTYMGAPTPHVPGIPAVPANKTGLVWPTGVKDALLKARPGKSIPYRPTLPGAAYLGGGIQEVFGEGEYGGFDEDYETGGAPLTEEEATGAVEAILNPNQSMDPARDKENAKVVDADKTPPSHADTGAGVDLDQILADELKRQDPGFQANAAFKSVLDRIGELAPNHPILSEGGPRPGMDKDAKHFRDRWRRGRAQRLLTRLETEASDRTTRLGSYDAAIERWKQDNPEHPMAKREGSWTDAEKERFLRWYNASGASAALANQAKGRSPFLGAPVVPSAAPAPTTPPFDPGPQVPDLDTPDQNATGQTSQGTTPSLDDEGGMGLGDYALAGGATAALLLGLKSPKGRRKIAQLIQHPREFVASMPGVKNSPWAKDITRGARVRNIDDSLRTVTSPRSISVRESERLAKQEAIARANAAAEKIRRQRLGRNPGGASRSEAPIDTDPLLRPPGDYPRVSPPTHIVDPLEDFPWR